MTLAQRNPDLAQRQQLLLARSAALRLQIAQDATLLGPPLAMADKVVLGWHWLKANPVVWGAGVAALVVWRPRRIVRTAGQLWSAWRLWRSVRRRWEWLQRLTTTRTTRTTRTTHTNGTTTTDASLR